MSEVLRKAILAKEASRDLAILNSKEKNYAIKAIAEELEKNIDLIIQENKKDIEAAEKENTPAAIIDRLLLNEDRIRDMIVGLEQIIDLEDPIGQVIMSNEIEAGLNLDKVRVPFGLIGIIYEARPNVTIDAVGLCIKTGNSVILRGGSNAINSNICLVNIVREALAQSKVSVEAVQYIEGIDRGLVEEMLTLNNYLDLVIPRGGAGLIQMVVEKSTVPVIETGSGVCHLYIDETADEEMARQITINAKTQRPGVCNAIETLLVHPSWAKEHLKQLVDDLIEKDVKLLGCKRSQILDSRIAAAQDDDYGREFLDLILAIKVIDNVDEAINHINKHGTMHSEAIVTNDGEAAKLFLAKVDAAAVYHNASTRYTDGFQYGFGAEIGISTQKLHARGPMGLVELSSYKYQIRGQGQTRK